MFTLEEFLKKNTWEARYLRGIIAKGEMKHDDFVQFLRDVSKWHSRGRLIARLLKSSIVVKFNPKLVEIAKANRESLQEIVLNDANRSCH